MSGGASRGWIGKLPCAGDFLCHGLSTGVASMLDNWLSSNLRWLDNYVSDWAGLYMQAPACGFLINGGFFNDSGMHSDVVGLLMPSVDSVGRLFPFLILQAMQYPTQQERQALNLVLNAIWNTCAQALHSNLTISELNLNLDEQLGIDTQLHNQGSWCEPAILNGPLEWYCLQPAKAGELLIHQIESLSAWPNESCFLRLLDSEKKFDHE